MAVLAAELDESLNRGKVVYGERGERDRKRSGAVESVREYDPGRGREQINGRRDSGRGSVSTKRCIPNTNRALRFHAGGNDDEKNSRN